MPKYVAFLRAINVGGHVVKMDQLRRMFSDLGFANVETFIASGNVIFDSNSKNIQALERKIEKHLQAELGYAVVTFVRSAAEVAELSAYNPFKKEARESDALFIGFLSESLSKDTAEKLRACSSESDVFHVRGREFFWLLRTKISDSKFFGPLLERTLGTKTTLRNVNTIRRLAAKYE